MRPPVLQTWKLADIREYLLQRCFAVPKLQRNFVWDAGRSAKLLDSIYRNMPIGSIFLWEMSRRSAHFIRQSADVLPMFNNSNNNIWFVIDGQQRLSVIHQAFEGDTRKNDAGRDIDFGRLCFVVHADKNQESPQRIVYRKPDYRRLIPIRDILAPDWKNRMPSKAKAFISVIKGCRERFLKYPIPVVIVSSATLEQIGEVFVRVNSQGMRIRSADRAIARMGNLDVRQMAEELRGKVRDEVFALGNVDAILMGFNLVTERPSHDSDPPKLEAMALRWSRKIDQNELERKEFEKQWDKFQRAFLSAVDYIHNQFPVHNEAFLPSANMLATLSVFFFYHRGQPNRHQRNEIRKWFWATGVAKRYSGAGYHRNIVADAKFFEALAGGLRRHFVLKERLDPVVDLQAEAYNANSSRTKAFFCLLAGRKPRYLENAEPIPWGTVISFANQKHRHHIFPQAQLRQHFPSRVVNSLCNVCFLVSQDNQRIGMRLPRRYLAEYRQADRKHFTQVMRSHLIPVGTESPVWERGTVQAFKRFRADRLALICAAFEKEAGMKLFLRN
jgi:hypothetical protein